MLKAKLVVVGGEAKAAEVSLSLPTVIGRGREANLTLPHPLVSRQHCELFEQEGMLHVRDMKSLNGTYVNNQRIETTSMLEPDQLLTIGNVTFRAIYETGQAIAANEPIPQSSNVIDFEEVSSADSDSKLDPVVDEAPSIHSRSTVPGKRVKETNSEPDAVADEVETVPEPGSASSPASANPVAHGSSDVLDEQPDAGTPAQPRHSIVAAMNQAGVAESKFDNATISEIRHQLPDSVRPNSGGVSGLDGLVVDAKHSVAEQAEISSIDLDETTSDKIDAEESSLDSFIRKLPR